MFFLFLLKSGFICSFLQHVAAASFFTYNSHPQIINSILVHVYLIVTAPVIHSGCLFFAEKKGKKRVLKLIFFINSLVLRVSNVKNSRQKK